MVRGFALFGVLLVNMYNFGATWPIWTGAADRVAFGAMRFLFETKSWRLFSFLFGLGFSLQLLGARRRGQPFLARYLRRLATLFAIGAVHALFYDGDIMMLYAELGLLLGCTPLAQAFPSRRGGQASPVCPDSGGGAFCARP